MRVTLRAAEFTRDIALEATWSTAEPPTNENSENTANGANDSSMRPITNGHTAGSQIEPTASRPLVIMPSRLIISGPVSSRAPKAAK